MAHMTKELMQTILNKIAYNSCDKIAFIGDFSKEALELTQRTKRLNYE